jgi:dienelactone hydrolase
MRFNTDQVIYLLLLTFFILQHNSAAQIRSFSELARLYDYDKSLSLDVQQISEQNREGISMSEISYASPKGGRVTALLLVPAGKGPFAGIIFMHPAGANESRKTFLTEALELAKAGALCLLIDAPFARPAPWGKPAFNLRQPENDRNMFIQTIVDLRRAVDLLFSRREIDKKKIGYVGFSFGGSVGGILAGIEKRIKAFALMSGGLALSEFWRSSQLPGIIQMRKQYTVKEIDDYVRTTSIFDAANYIGHGSPSRLLFQFGDNDPNVSKGDALAYYGAASKPKQLLWFKGGHALNREAFNQRFEWFHDQLGIKPFRAERVEK